jgi:hypothetical protein
MGVMTPEPVLHRKDNHFESRLKRMAGVTDHLRRDEVSWQAG